MLVVYAIHYLSQVNIFISNCSLAICFHFIGRVNAATDMIEPEYEWQSDTGTENEENDNGQKWRKSVVICFFMVIEPYLIRFILAVHWQNDAVMQ